METTYAAARGIWIRNPGFDLAFVLGGAFFTLLVAVLTFLSPGLLPVFFWIWIVAFEGSHFWATFSRTYLDTKFREENRRVLLGSLIFFALPVLAVLADSAFPEISFTTLYGFFIFSWSLYHNARQHYGFTSIYCAKAGIQGESRDSVVRALYLVIVCAQAHFLLNFKIQGVFGVASASQVTPTLAWFLDGLPKTLTALGTLYAIFVSARLFAAYGKRSAPTIFYLFTCLLFYSAMFYFIAPRDLFVQGAGGAQKLMLIAIMNSLFHNIQYHAIVWHYGRSRYGGRTEVEFGPARRINSTASSYFAFALGMGALFGLIVWNVGDWPGPSGSYDGVAAYKWAFVVFFGIIGHHFYLDQKIWRPSRQADLRGYLA